MKNAAEQDYIGLLKVSTKIGWNKIGTTLEGKENINILFQIDNISQIEQPVSAISLVSNSPLRNANIS